MLAASRRLLPRAAAWRSGGPGFARASRSAPGCPRVGQGSPSSPVLPSGHRPLLSPFCASQRHHSSVVAWSSPSVTPAVEMEVTRHNFGEALPRVRAALDACDYFAFDCEMTGLFMRDDGGSYLDEIEDRYLEMVESAQGFVISQFGLSTFAWSPQEGAFCASTFNFWLFPRPAEGLDRRFVCQASSLDFLAACHFDFNKFVYDGISYLPASTRDARLAGLERAARANRPGILIRKQEDIDFVCALVSAVTAWLGTDEEALLLDSCNSYQRAIQYQELRKPQFGAAQPPGFYVERVEGEDGRPALRLRRAAPGEVAAFEEEQRRARIQAVHDAAGFTAVFEAMRDSRKPAVGHNLSFDLAYSLASYAGPLPPSWEAYKAMVARWFPGGVYDTKHLARQLPGAFPDTTLGVLHDGLLKGGLQEQVNAFLASLRDPAAAAAAAAAAGTAAAHVAADEAAAAEAGALLSIDLLPEVGHAPGYERYEGADTGQYAHEAGYDAYMTGAVFACLVRLFELGRAAAASGPLPADAAQPSLAAVQDLRWRMNLSRTDIAYAALQGPDPRPNRSHVFHLSGWAPGQAPRGGGDIARRLADSGLGDVRVSLVEGGAGALVELSDPESTPIAADVLAQRFPSWEAATFAAYSARRAAQRAEAAAAAERRNGNGKRPRVEGGGGGAPGGGAAARAWCSIM